MTPASPPVDIVLGQFVSVVAMGPSGVASAFAVATKKVGACGDRFQVIGAHASAVAAQMVKLHPFGYGADFQRVGDTVRLPLLATPKHASVPGAGLASEPKPAVAGRVDERPKAGDGFHSEMLARRSNAIA